MTKQELIFTLTHKLETAKEQVAKFQEKLAKDPAHAFTWADAAMKAAAEIEVFGLILGKMGSEAVTVEAVQKMAMQKTMHAARWPASSSSAVSNVMESKLGSTWAELLDMV